VLNLLSNLYANAERPLTYRETLKVFRNLTPWLQACNAFEAMLHVHADGLQSPDMDVVAVFEALGVFAAIFLGNPGVKSSIKSSLSQSKFRFVVGSWLGIELRLNS